MSHIATAPSESDSNTTGPYKQYKELLLAIDNNNPEAIAELIARSGSHQIRGDGDLAVDVYEQLVATPRLLSLVSSCLSEQAQSVVMTEQARILRIRHRLWVLAVSQHELPQFR